MAETIKYSFEMRPLSNENGKGFLVTFPDLPGCISDGETIEEAIANAMDAEHSWIETARGNQMRTFNNVARASRRASGLKHARRAHATTADL